MAEKAMVKRRENYPLVSVIIVNYNAGPMLLNCARAVLTSTVTVEVILVDNNSTDESLHGMRAILREEPHLSIIKNERNVGFAKAVNVGLAGTHGAIILVLNPDCIIEATTLERMLRVLEQHSDAGMLGPRILNPDGTEQPGCRRNIPTPWRSFLRAFGLSYFLGNRLGFLSDFLLHRAPVPSKPVDVEAISGAFMLIRRSALDEVGLLDEGYFMHCEDLDWCMRFREKGWRIWFVPDVSVTHYKGACSKDRPIRVLWHMHKGMIRFYRKFFRGEYPVSLMWLVAAGVWMRFSALALYHLAKHGIGARRAR